MMHANDSTTQVNRQLVKVAFAGYEPIRSYSNTPIIQYAVQQQKALDINQFSGQILWWKTIESTWTGPIHSVIYYVWKKFITSI